MQSELNIVGDYIGPTEFARRNQLHYYTLRRLLDAGLIVPDARMNSGQPLFRASRLGQQEPVIRAIRRNHVIEELVASDPKLARESRQRVPHEPSTSVTLPVSQGRSF
jgi:hypothetical protein